MIQTIFRESPLHTGFKSPNHFSVLGSSVLIAQTRLQELGLPIALSLGIPQAPGVSLLFVVLNKPYTKVSYFFYWC